MQQSLNRHLHTKDIELFFQAVEPFINQIAEGEKGKLHPEIKKQLQYYFDLTTEEHRARLIDKFPKCVAYATEIAQELPNHQDYWTEANVGDIVRKTGTHYVSNIENGNYYVVLEANHDHAVVFDVDGQIKTLCFPEEYEVVGHIQEKLEARHQEIKLNSKKININIWEQNGLARYERETVDAWLQKGKESDVMDYFTENWRIYYDLGIEQEEKGLDTLSRLFGHKLNKEESE